MEEMTNVLRVDAGVFIEPLVTSCLVADVDKDPKVQVFLRQFRGSLVLLHFH